MLQTSSGKKIINAITVSINNLSLTIDGENNLHLSETISKKGDGLIIENGKIKIGRGVKHIFVSGSVQFLVKTIGTKNFMIYKNNQCINRSLNSANINKAANVVIHVTPVLIDVEEGDLISATIYGSIGDTLNPTSNGTHITVIAI